MPKATVLDNVIRKLARERADRLRSAYLANGMSAEELAAGEAELKAELAPMFKTWKPSMRRRIAGMTGIMNDGYFKNIFEAERSAGYYDPTDRSTISEGYFGAADGSAREKYGYLRRPKKYGNDDVEHYGGYEIEFRPAVRKRMTVTNGDSFNNWEGGLVRQVAPGTPIVIDDPDTYINWMGMSNSEFDRDPDIYNSRIMRKVLDDLKSYHRPTSGNADYIEAQFHGPLTVRDIKSIRVPDSFSPDHMVRGVLNEKIRRRSDENMFPVYNYDGECIYNCR